MSCLAFKKYAGKRDPRALHRVTQTHLLLDVFFFIFVI